MICFPADAGCFLRLIIGRAAITPIVTARSMITRGGSVAVSDVGGRGLMPVSDSTSTLGVKKVILALLLEESVAVSVCVPL